MTRLPLLALTLAVAIGCGGDDSPTNPGPPAPPPVPNYTGIWNGTYTVTGCTQSGLLAFVNICGSLTPGSTLNYQLNLIQQGTTITAGNFTLGTLAFNVNPAALNAAGGVSVSGTHNTGTLTILSTWNLSAPIVGTMTEVWTGSGVSGQANVSTVIGSTVKTGSARPPTAMPMPQSFEGLLRALHE